MSINSLRTPDEHAPAVIRLRQWFFSLFGAPKPSPFRPEDAIAVRMEREGYPTPNSVDDTLDERTRKPDPAGDPEVHGSTRESHVTLPSLRAIKEDPDSDGFDIFFAEEEEEIPGHFKFVGRVFDAEARRAAFSGYPAALEKAKAILSDLLNEASPEDPRLRKFHEIKRGLVKAYHEYARVTAALTGQREPLRKPAEVLAWDVCALPTVNIPLSENVKDPLSAQQKEFYRFFVEITVLFDIALDDAGETLRDYKAEQLSKFVANYSAQRLIHGNTSPVDYFEGYGDLSDHEKAYVRLVESLTTLLDQAIDALCDLDTLEDDEHKSQIVRMRDLMMADRRDLVRMIAFATELDDMIHNVEGARHSVQRVFEGGQRGREITRDNLPTRAEMNKYTQQNIFLRFMMMGRHIQVWRNMPPKERSRFNFETLQGEMETYGTKLNSLGNPGNDFGSMLKEVRERTFNNSIFAKAWENKDIRISDLVRAQNALNSMSGPEAIGLLGAIMNNYYLYTTHVRWEAIEARFSNDSFQPVILLMKALLKPEGAYISCLKVWDEELAQLSANTSEMKKLYNIDRHTQDMVEFLMRYIQASLYKLKL